LVLEVSAAGSPDTLADTTAGHLASAAQRGDNCGALRRHRPPPRAARRPIRRRACPTVAA